ncbi:MAG: gliding motility lipoprotein GldH [Bacteroidetes bacterium]|nr:gliding motility lipoprotein GldH [Bacteroidota bacterium]
MTKNLNRKRLLFLIFLPLLLTSCNSNVVFTDSKEIKENKWQLMDLPVFNVTISDTINSNNLFFTIRTGSDYPFRNIFLFVTATSPDGKNLTDTLQYYLADDKGKWYGKGFGDIHELSLPYKSNVFFPSRGEYVFKIQHGMRTEGLPGVYDIGLRIEKNSK